MKNLEKIENKVLFALLAHELFGKEIEINSEAVDWHQLLMIANDHAITPLLYSGIKQLPSVPQDVFDIVERSAVRSTIQAERMGQVQSELFVMLDNAGIKAVVLKGTSLAMNYPHPEVRITGDIDILVPKEELEKCGELLINEGYVLEGISDIHTNYRKKRVLVEVHQAISRYPENHKGEYTKSLMQTALDNVRFGCVGRYQFPMLGEPHYTIALLAHMERHMGSAGIGLRQLCDWAMAVSAMDPETGARSMLALDKCGLLKYAQVLTDICCRYLRMPECQWLPTSADNISEEAMEDILSVGNFQAQHAKRPFASAVIEPYDLYGDGRRRVFSTYFRRVRRRMQTEYPWAQSVAWVPLFGLFFFVRWAFSIVNGKVSIQSMLNTIASARKREQLLRKMQLYK